MTVAWCEPDLHHAPCAPRAVWAQTGLVRGNFRPRTKFISCGRGRRLRRPVRLPPHIMQTRKVFRVQKVGGLPRSGWRSPRANHFIANSRPRTKFISHRRDRRPRLSALCVGITILHISGARSLSTSCMNLTRALSLQSSSVISLQTETVCKKSSRTSPTTFVPQKKTPHSNCR